MSMTPTTTTTTTMTHRAITEPSVQEAILDAESHLEQAQDIVLQLWTSAMPQLDGSRAATLVAVHRAITEARTMLDDSITVVVAQPAH